MSHTETNTNWMFSSTSTGRIVLSAWMPTAGYLPGQDIQLLVSVDNESPNSLSHFVVCLMRVSGISSNLLLNHKPFILPLIRRKASTKTRRTVSTIKQRMTLCKGTHFSIGNVKVRQMKCFRLKVSTFH